MADWRGAVWLAGFVVCWALPGALKAEDESDVRLNAEARLLFKAEVFADQPPSQPCELDSTWDSYLIPESVAREYLGLRLHAELSSPYSATTPAEILDSADSGFLCGADETKKRESELFKQFEAGTEKSLEIRRTHFTFPVFLATTIEAPSSLSRVAFRPGSERPRVSSCFRWWRWGMRLSMRRAVMPGVVSRRSSCGSPECACGATRPNRMVALRDSVDAVRNRPSHRTRCRTSRQQR